MRRVRMAIACSVVLALAVVGCSEADDDTVDAAATAPDDTGAGSGSAASDDAPAEPGDDDITDADPATSGESVVERFAGQPWTYGTVPDTPVAADSDAAPIVIGMANQENSPAGSFPEVRGAVEAGVEWINTELGGVDGRPLELVTCITSFSVEQSQACAQQLVQSGAVALVGGIDVSSNGSFPVFEENGLPQIGGIPVNLSDQQSPVAFFFSGGTIGGMAAFLDHAAATGAETVLLGYGEYEPFTVAAQEYGVPLGESLGLDLDLVPFPLLSNEFLPVFNRAQQVGADAVIVLAADASCVPAMELFDELGLGESSQLYLVGACAGEEITATAGDAVDGVIFNSEGPAETDLIDGALFYAVTEQYATGPSAGAGTVSFRGLLNLWDLLGEIGADDIGSERILAAIRSTDGHRSFWGHEYTCAVEQVPGLPALCAPQETLMRIEDGEITPFGDWIDTVALFAAAGIDP